MGLLKWAFGILPLVFGLGIGVGRELAKKIDEYKKDEPIHKDKG
jgi:hypothetical protein